MNYYTTIRQKQCKKSELTPIVDEYARAIEAEEGTVMWTVNECNYVKLLST